MFVLLSQRPALGRGRPHRRHSMFHRTRQVLAPFASSACAHLLLPNCAVWPSWSDCPSSAVVSVVRAPLGRSRQTLWWISCASFGSLSCTSSKADSLWFPPQHPELDHTASTLSKSRHGEALCPSQRSGPSRHVIMFLPKMNWSASLWWTQHLRSCANMWRNGVQKMTARVNVTSESALLPLCSHCPLRPSSTGAEPTMLQATWREQAHRARTPLRSTCFAAAKTGPQGPSLVKSRFAGHGTRVMSRRNASAHHLRQFVPHSNNSIKLRVIKCF